ncbi:ATP-binding protein [Pseudoalteromonas luteoviolacea]|uniref:histidine kinase n=1 Tax=Pseudoalteromonas luteoviolacea H33 TaxID=1365251 RepID=A0A167B518_9GAMM|nr:ATP-binding protein [Pseudoalteromonas luteoviolacea]KZN46162.1 hypothetical protein N476_03305 [Pseudoalteromonas luteoviolacea H33]KZN75183.1 hypothetical protein N477_20090 [Pseudoalteromonas luteoviolacea H33-S]MBQ4875802.1 response regulator [Pseudoalteromonas luteoviolacea]MBQ4904837.1 response regulator [Pseudoalteromonas luteoviolacea]
MPNSTFSFLASESSQAQQKPQRPPWKVLVVDDEPEVHEVTKMALSKFSYQDRGLSFLHAYSKAQAIECMQSEQDISVILLDVIMETDQAGLECVHHIRNELNDHDVRIILRTGQPSTIPEHEVMLKYDINDYKNKVDLTKSRLYITMTSALRAFQDIKKQSELASALKDLNENLEVKVAERTAELLSVNTSLQAAKDQILAQQASLLQSEKMASIGYLAAGMAHEINNPLGALKCNFSVLQDYINAVLNKVDVTHDEDLDNDFKDIFELLEDNAVDLNRIERIVAALSVFNGISDEQANLYDLHEIVTSFSAEIHSQVVFENKHEPLPKLSCCREQLLQVFKSLYLNAKESGSALCDIKISIRNHEQSMSVYFEDKGAGIPEQKLNQIFDPFYTTKPVGANVGLGLTIALMMVQNQGAELIATSQLGVGSCFEVRLPHNTSS